MRTLSAIGTPELTPFFCEGKLQLSPSVSGESAYRLAVKFCAKRNVVPVCNPAGWITERRAGAAPLRSVGGLAAGDARATRVRRRPHQLGAPPSHRPRPG